jgi:murein DD-endopeptidase MepM/ murein hydrolase activator NlpD
LGGVLTRPDLRYLRLLLAAGASVVLLVALRTGTLDLPGSADTRAARTVERIGTGTNAQSRSQRSLPETAPTARLPFEPRVDKDLAYSTSTSPQSSPEYPDSAWRNVTVAPGDNLSLMFNRIGASRQDLEAILDISKEARSAMTRLAPGQVLRFRLDGSAVQEIVFEQDFLTSVRFSRDGGKFKAEWIEEKPEIRQASAVAEITHSLFIDGQRAGLSDKTIMEFIGVFGWDVDFLRDLQRGDQFSVVFEEVYKDGMKIASGKILAAEFINKGKRLRAIYYEHDDGIAGYYSDKGEAMRKAFLRTPVNFTRISSRFSLARRHPILNRVRAHRGVDYSAPTGTPIQAVADGKVIFAGWKGGYGNVVQLKHGSAYSTLYGHMTNFARGIRNGQTVSQGQTIGYVGRTGLATGPHLHYEFMVNGVHRDPMTVKLPNALPLDTKYLTDFKRQAAPLIARIDTLGPSDTENKPTMVAKVEKPRIPAE